MSKDTGLDKSALNAAFKAIETIPINQSNKRIPIAIKAYLEATYPSPAYMAASVDMIGMDKGWCVKAASKEDGLDIGAGSLSTPKPTVDVEPVQRYDPAPIGDGIAPYENGSYVKFTDYQALQAERDKLEVGQKQVLIQISDLSRQLGEAKGKLEVSEWPGVVDGWKKRAEKAEAELSELRAILIERDGGVHDADCKALRPTQQGCNCGHDDVVAALKGAG